MVDRADTFVVLHAPLHGVTATHREMRRAKKIKNFQGRTADAIVFSEAYRHKKWFSTMWLLWRVVTGPLTKPDPRHRIASWDVIILVRRRFKTIWKSARLAAEASVPLKIAPRRWIVEWRGKTRIGEVSLVFEHPHAGIMSVDLNPRVDRVQKYIEQSRLFKVRLEHSIVSGFGTIGGGDLQIGRYRSNQHRPDWVPQEIFKDLSMDAHNEGVDWLAASENLVVIDVDIIPASVVGQDHPWILMTVARG